MKSKVQNTTFNPKFLFLAFFFLLFIILFTLMRSNNNSETLSKTTTTKTTMSMAPQTLMPPCTKIPQTLTDTLLHYATSNTTPQQTINEISVSARVLKKKSPCNFLVFGLGHDSLMWAALNHGGRTVFLEEDESWIETVRERFPTLESYHVEYDTKVSEADELMEQGRRPECTVVSDVEFSECRLALRGMPSVFYEVAWDVIMVDAPTGWVPEAPGRMGAIYTAGMVARGKKGGEETDVFVHDVDRVVEDRFSKEFLCEGYMEEEEGRLRHFNIPSHRESMGMPFCPDRED